METTGRLNRELPDKNGALYGENPLVVIVGEHLETGVHVVEAFMEDLSRVTGQIVLLLARRDKLLSPKAEDPALLEYEYFVALARRLGVGAEVKFLRSRDPYKAVLSECEGYAETHPDAVFCFIEWGLGGEVGLEKTLAAKQLKTTNLFELASRKAERETL